MKKQTAQHHIDSLAALLLFGVFAACVLVVLLTGADAYRRLSDRDKESYDRRSCQQYIATQVRQADSADGVRVEEFGGVDALVLHDGLYVTRIYCYGGSLMELYALEALPLSPEDGEKVMPLDALELSLDGSLLTVTLPGTQDGSDTLLLYLRSGEGAAT